LNHRCFLSFAHHRQQYSAPIRKFERIVMRGRLVIVDLSKDRRLGEVINSDQTPSVRASKLRRKLFWKQFQGHEMLQHSLVRQKFGYFRVIAVILIVTAALCWGLTHI
jgi:hypothetical protein